VGTRPVPWQWGHGAPVGTWGMVPRHEQ